MAEAGHTASIALNTRAALLAVTARTHRASQNEKPGREDAPGFRSAMTARQGSEGGGCKNALPRFKPTKPDWEGSKKERTAL
jgi:hypothetical protein